MEQKEPAGGQKRMSSVIKKYMFVLRSESVLGKLVHEREMHVLYVLAEHNGITLFQGPVMEFSSQVRNRVWPTCICLTVYTNRQDQDLTRSESEKDLWHNSSTGYSHGVSVWSCVYIWQYVDILDQFPLTLVSGTLSLIFHHQGA